MPFFTRTLPAAALPFASFSSFAPGTVQTSSTLVLDRIRDTDAVRAAHRESSVPFSFYDTDKEPVGYAMNLCLRVVDKLRTDLKRPNLKVQYVMVTPSTRVPAIIEGKADPECGSTTNNRKHREEVTFAVPHYIMGIHMFVKTSSGIRKRDNLHGETIVTTKGITNVVGLREANGVRVLNMNSLGTEDHARSFAIVETNKADAFAADDVLLYSFRVNTKTLGDYAIVGDTLTIESCAIMLSKDDTEFKRLVGRAMTNIILDYDAEKLYKRWFQQPIPPHNVEFDIPMSFLLHDSFKYPNDRVAD